MIFAAAMKADRTPISIGDTCPVPGIADLASPQHILTPIPGARRPLRRRFGGVIVQRGARHRRQSCARLGERSQTRAVAIRNEAIWNVHLIMAGMSLVTRSKPEERADPAASLFLNEVGNRRIGVKANASP
ncbi:hypothetical protein Pla52o_21550 [Novipirellula galeiformis]|uniref:Uncharacterized protein n=1 Tax=Novipirellula galeiformis TaxID=2528004 RepID=A0A5C6CN60_9BACT|nr:hypothetical protein Pla52o_21550 [Novipirellula galeiformis]